MLLPAEALILPAAQQLLQGLTALVTASTDMSEHGTAAACVGNVYDLLLSGAFQENRPGSLLPSVAAAVALGDLLIHGGSDSSGSDQPSTCTCYLISSAAAAAAGGVEPVLGLRRAHSRMPGCHGAPAASRTGPKTCRAVAQLSSLQMMTELTDIPADHYLVTSRAALALCLQHTAMCLLHLRHQRPAGAGSNISSGGGGGAGSSCANPAAFLGSFDVAGCDPQADEWGGPTDPLMKLAHQLMYLLTVQLAPGAPTCPRCAPEQVLLIVGALTAHPDQARCALLSTLSFLVQGRPWQAAFMRRAAPTLSAWVVAAAQQLPVSAAAAGAGASAISSEAAAAPHMTEAVLEVVRLIVQLPGGVLQAPDGPEEQQAQQLEQLLACAERALRCSAGGERAKSVGLALEVLQVRCRRSQQGWQMGFTAAPGKQYSSPHVLTCFATCPAQAFVAHPPSCFDELWRSGSLAGLVTTICKRADGSDAGAWMMPLEQPVAMADLMHSLLPEPGHQPWYAASAERQQFALFALARLGGRLVASLAVLKSRRPAGAVPVSASGAEEEARVIRQHGEMLSVASALHAAAVQLGRQPLRQVLKVAAPALLPAADDLVGGIRPCDHSQTMSDGSARLRVGMEDRVLDLFAALPRQLDPLALGLALPGCWNPACTSLAGASEADMKLKRCTACKTARWAAVRVGCHA